MWQDFDIRGKYMRFYRNTYKLKNIYIYIYIYIYQNNDVENKNF